MPPPWPTTPSCAARLAGELAAARAEVAALGRRVAELTASRGLATPAAAGAAAASRAVVADTPGSSDPDQRRLGRALKRALAEEQNDLLDRACRSRQLPPLDELLPDPAARRRALAAAAAPSAPSRPASWPCSSATRSGSAWPRRWLPSATAMPPPTPPEPCTASGASAGWPPCSTRWPVVGPDPRSNGRAALAEPHPPPALFGTDLVGCSTVRAPADMPPRRRRRRVSNRGRVALIVTAAVLFLLFTSLRGIATFWTDYLWFDSVQLSSVFTTVLGSKIALGVIFTLVFFVLLWVNLAIADRIAPKFRPAGPEDELLDRYHAMVDRRAGLLRAAVALGFAILAGASVSSQWQQWLMFVNAKEFPERDAIFDTNVGFYVFKLPFYSFVVDWLIAAFVIILLVTMVAHYLNGGIRLQAPFQRVTPQVKAHMSVLLAVLALLKAVSYWLERYQLVFSQRGTVNGATYTDVKAQLPAIYLLLLISLLACGLFIFNIWQRGWTLPVVAVGLWALVAVVAGVAYPAFVQRFQVTPDESAKERPYIENNIQATRQGFGLTNDRAEVRQFEYDPSREAGARGVVNNPGTIRNVRLLDPERVPDTYNRLQGFQNFYRFADLDVDRYRAKVPGTDQTAETLTVISSRDLNVSQIPQQTWENRVLAYTHGYGVAVANASAVGPSGDPDFIVQDIPINVEDGIDAKVDQPFLYFGEFPTGANTYAIADTLREEVAYVDRNSNTVYARYQGDGGVVLDSWLRKAAFALRFADWNPLLSNFVTDQSKLIYLRDVHERVTEAAPFLDWDANPYPVMANGRIVYLIDGYTTTPFYPNSQIANPDGVPDRSTLDAHKFNYIRNSVKASVDAYDGTIKIYVWDTKDPIIAAYQSAFPSLFSSSDQMPAELFQHVRYPEDLFRVQTNMWGRYRLDNPDAFYQRTGAWSVASDPPSTPQSNTSASTTSTSTPTGFGAVAQQPPKPRATASIRTTCCSSSRRSPRRPSC